MNFKHINYDARRRSFGAVAKLYHQARPGYPDAMFCDIAEQLQLKEIKTPKILEIGAGTGKATLPLASIASHIVAVEPDPEMAAVLLANSTRYNNIKIQQQKFEDLIITPSCFDLVASAQAFHWIPKEVSYPLVHAFLKPAGSFALLRNSTNFNGWDLKVRGAIDEVYARYHPDTAVFFYSVTVESEIEDTSKEINDTGLFMSLEVRRYQWNQWYSSTAYIDLLNTHSENRIMADSQREKFFNEVKVILDENGGGLNYPYESLLFTAVKI